MEKPEWFSEWTKPGSIDEEGIACILGMPESVRSIMKKIPPGCVVEMRTEVEFKHLFFGPLAPYVSKYGICSSYVEDGMVGIRPTPEGDFSFEYAKAEDLKVIGYHRSMTHQKIIGVLLAGE